MATSNKAIVGSLLGTAVGDALGLPYEGLSSRRARRMFGSPDRYRLILRRGMVSDDTEHACMTAQALVSAGGDVERFARKLAWNLRRWLLTMPAGIGLATLRSTVRLWLGFTPYRSGVFSAGNGPAMRSPLLGVAIDKPETLRQFVRASTRLTHTDPQAETGALAVALAARIAATDETIDGQEYLRRFRSLLMVGDSTAILVQLERAVASSGAGDSTVDFASSCGLHKGVTGYINHTVPVVIHAWLRNQQDYRAAVTEVILCGGDTDTLAAIVGGIVGARVGKPGIPSDWLAGLWEWPRTIDWIERLGEQLHETVSHSICARPLRLPAVGLLGRNAIFALIVLGHGFRRLAPPY